MDLPPLSSLSPTSGAPPTSAAPIPYISSAPPVIAIPSTPSSLQQPSRPRRDLRGKVAIVTGAGSLGTEIGNGRAISILLAEDGASVVCVDRDREAAMVTVRMINATTAATANATATAVPGQQQDASNSKGADGGVGGVATSPLQPPTPRRHQAIAIEADVTQERDCERVVETAVDWFGRVDILVNNVGILGPKGTALEVDPEAWSAAMTVNVTSMMLMSRYAIAAMLQNEPVAGANGNRGSIVNLGSVAGLMGGTAHLFYPTSKGAVVNMTRAMAAQHGEEGIRVNCVCPGMLYTPMMYGNGMTPEVRESRKSRSLLKTEGNAWDCASAVRFLAGDEARWITGSILTVDAGATAAFTLPQP